jgi:hypothetical protein
LGSVVDPDFISFGGEFLTYRLGNIKRIAVRMVEANTANVKRKSNIVTWLLGLLSA